MTLQEKIIAELGVKPSIDAKKKSVSLLILERLHEKHSS